MSMIIYAAGDAQGLVNYKFIPERLTVNKEKSAQNSWFLLHDNTTAHQSLMVRTHLAKHNVTALEHQPYSTDLSPLDFVLFPKLKNCSEKTIIRKCRGSH
jgi:hypothetical protein